MKVDIKIKKLRDIIYKYDLSGYVIPSNDQYGNSNTQDHDKRLEYISGFTGSYGMLFVLNSIILLFTDKRYIDQARLEVDNLLFQIIDISFLNTFNWNIYLTKDCFIGYDPKLFSKSIFQKLSNINFKSITENLVDLIWEKQPKLIRTPIYLYEDKFAGESYYSKLNRLREYIIKESAVGIFITSVESICWLLNLRASDNPYTPLFYCDKLLITFDSCFLCTDFSRFNFNLSIFRSDIVICKEDDFKSVIQSFQGLLLYDQNFISIDLFEMISNKNLRNIKDPCYAMMACKNELEILNAKQIHVLESMTICEFLSYLAQDKSLYNKTEYDLSVMIYNMRKSNKDYIMDSFPTIIGFQENASIVHYKPSVNNTKYIDGSGLLLIDTGGQYLGGTTDMTRTVVINKHTAKQKFFYTQILRGHIALSNIKFPAGTMGCNLDILARQYLWNNGNNYFHSTGHGVGNFLSVHEGLQSINLYNTVPLQIGMIISNEPGFYLDGEFGIRIENLMYITKSEYLDYLKFKTLTLIPYCKELIDMSLLTKCDIDYLSMYYGEIYNNVYPSLSKKAQHWLIEEIKDFI